MEKVNINDFIGKDLSSFKIVKMEEVFMTDEDGNYLSSIGFFKNAKIAKAYSKRQPDASYIKTSTEVVLTDGNVGFTLEDKEVKLFDDEDEALAIREDILSRLTKEEREILGV